MVTATIAALLAVAPIRVACVGDSITFGSGLPDRNQQSYPSRLQVALGSKFEVQNFGVGGRTLFRNGDTPYVETPQHQDVKDWEPEVVIIMLGTNDTVLSRRGNWDHEGDAERDMIFLIQEYVRYGFENFVIADPTPMIYKLDRLPAARRANLQVRAPRLAILRFRYKRFAREFGHIHFPTLQRVKWSSDMVTDGVHLTPKGADALAQALAPVIKELS